ncbi:hypothetical protein [Flavobacterium sp. JP2137]|uniref:hypothetical protein n=1 Tax=Flavobacterium sp. JP2137 TaxID=3414510 RepID=UPI003D2FCD19
MKKTLLAIIGVFLLISCSSDNTSTTTTLSDTGTKKNFDIDLRLNIQSYETIKVGDHDFKQVTLDDNIKLIIAPNSNEFSSFTMTNTIAPNGSGFLLINNKDGYFHQNYMNFQRLASLQKNAFRECI